MGSQSDLPRRRWTREQVQRPRMLTCGPETGRGAKARAIFARYVRHLTAIAIAIVAVAATRVELPLWREIWEASLRQERDSNPAASARGGSRDPEEELFLPSASVKTVLGDHPTPDAPCPTATPTMPTGTGGGDIELYPLPEPTEIVTRTWIITYMVQPGDIVGSIAQKFGISEETVCAANGRLADNPDYLRVGQILFILPVSGVLHIVEKGETLESIAKQYKAKVEDIVAFPGNGLSKAAILVEGQELIVPGGKKPYKPRVVTVWSGKIPKGASKGSGSFVWPTTGVITQKFWSQHQAIDIGWSEGTKVVAADSGYVVKVGNDQGYGRMVVIDHGNGFQTLYAHFKVYYVEPGQSVAKGETIGQMGSTGRSTGPHLHFEIRKNGVKVNPLQYLP